MKDLKIVATVVVKPEFLDDVTAAMRAVVDGTRTEEGNISYVLCADTKNMLRFVILEHWASQEAIDEHNESAHFKAFVAAIEGKVDSLDVAVLSEVY
ncbi:MAG: putative quinol monooxygenase [Rikenellaceae bacterium]